MKKDFEKVANPLLNLFDNRISLISVSNNRVLNNKKYELTEQICDNLKYMRPPWAGGIPL